MLRVALTGGIATGKSHVAQRLLAGGIPVIDSDALAHGVMTAGTEATAAIAARFGAGVLGPDGSVDRASLGPIVFADPAARRDLEAIVHPAVYRSIAAAVRALELTGSAPFVVVDIPLLFETGHAHEFDRVIVTTCGAETQIRRLRERGLSEAAARQRLAAQLPDGAKVAGADFVVRTDGSYEDTDRQVRQIVENLAGGRDA
jgi:dephospho-CoA kinase